MKIIPEQVIQQECFNWFNNTYCLKFHIPRLLIHSVPNGIPIEMDAKERARALDLLHKTGMVNGVSDLLIHGKKGRCIHAECKTDTGIQSEAQLDIQVRVEALGGIYFVFRNLEQFQMKIHEKMDWLLGKI